MGPCRVKLLRRGIENGSTRCRFRARNCQHTSTGTSAQRCCPPTRMKGNILSLKASHGHPHHTALPGILARMRDNAWQVGVSSRTMLCDERWPCLVPNPSLMVEISQEAESGHDLLLPGLVSLAEPRVLYWSATSSMCCVPVFLACQRLGLVVFT